MTRPETPKPEHWNDELQHSLTLGVMFATTEEKLAESMNKHQQQNDKRILKLLEDLELNYNTNFFL